MATNTVTTEQVREAIEQLAAMVAAASISPQTVAGILEMLRNLNDQERLKVIAVAEEKILEIQELGTGIEEALNDIVSSVGTASNEVASELGVHYWNRININIKANTSIRVRLNAPDGTFSNNKFVLYFYEKGLTTGTAIGTFDNNTDIIRSVNYDVRQIAAYKDSSGVLAANACKLEISTNIAEKVNVLESNYANRDEVPTSNSNKDVKSGGVFKSQGVMNISALYPTGGTEGTNVYASRGAARAMVPNAARKPGLIITYLTTAGYITEQYDNNTSGIDLTVTSNWQNNNYNWRDLSEANHVPLTFTELAYSIKADGTIGTSDVRKHSSPIAVSKGDILLLTTFTETASALLSLTDENGSSYTPVIIGNGQEKSSYLYFVKENGYVAISYYTLYKAVKINDTYSKVISDVAASTMGNTANIAKNASRIDWLNNTQKVYTSKDLTKGQYADIGVSSGYEIKKVANNVGYIKIPVSAGDSYTISTIGSAAVKAWILTDVNYTKLSSCDEALDAYSNPVTVTAAEDGYLFVNKSTSADDKNFYVAGIFGKDSVLKRLNGIMNGRVFVPDSVSSQSLINYDDGELAQNNNYTVYNYNVSEGDILYICGNYSTASNTRAWIAFYSGDRYIKEISIPCKAQRQVRDLTVIVPPGVNLMKIQDGYNPPVQPTVVLIAHLSGYGYGSESKNLLENYCFPDDIFSLCYDARTENIQTWMSVESVLKDAALDDVIKLNGAAYSPASPSTYQQAKQTNAKATFDKVFSLTSNKYLRIDKNVVIKSVKIANAQNKNIRLFGIGASNMEVGCWPHVVKLADHQNTDIGNISIETIGTRNTSYTDTYKGVTKTITVNHEARAGWALCDMLRHFCCIRITANMSSVMMNAEVGWASLGLITKGGTQTAEQWSNVPAKRLAIANTCHGKYDADPTAALWDWIVNKYHLTTFTYDGITYTFGSSYSSADDAAQIAAIKYICENQTNNKLYDYTLARQSDGTGATMAFDCASYLNKYSFDTPTHVVIMAGGNDQNIITSKEDYQSHIVNDVKLLSANIKSVSASIIIGVAASRLYAVYYPEEWVNIGIVNKVSGQNFWYYCHEAFINGLASYANCDYIPTYCVQSVLGSLSPTHKDSYTGKDVIEDYNTDVMNGSTQPLHAVGEAYNSVAYEILAWVYYNL